ncbi:hypothetical protein HOD29_07025 [archaeon]|jgi:hypothetical protein|nr:hypothetical protein [archaeon]
MNKKYTMGIFALFAIALLGVGIVSAFGSQGKMLGLGENERAEMEAFHSTIEEAIESGDYDSWRALKESMLTEEHFLKIQERHSERETHQAERQEAFEKGERPERGQDFGNGMGMHKGMRNSGNFGECPFAE